MPARDLVQGACGLVAGWAGQPGVLVPWDMTAVAVCGIFRHLPSTSDLSVNYMMNNTN